MRNKSFQECFNMTPELSKLRELEAKATPRPWPVDVLTNLENDNAFGYAMCNHATELIKAAEELERHKNSCVCDDNESPCGQCAECAMLACADEFEMVAQDRDIARGEVDRLKGEIEGWTEHNPLCDALDLGPDGIDKPCNCFRVQFSALKDENAKLKTLLHTTVDSMKTTLAVLYKGRSSWAGNDFAIEKLEQDLDAIREALK